MGKVITVPQWGNARPPIDDRLVQKFVSCDQFIRSKVVPPPLGSIVFCFKGGKVTITGDTTSIAGGDCEIVVRGNFVHIGGSEAQASAIFCSIHREIEEIRGEAAPFKEASRI